MCGFGNTVMGDTGDRSFWNSTNSCELIIVHRLSEYSELLMKATTIASNLCWRRKLKEYADDLELLRSYCPDSVFWNPWSILMLCFGGETILMNLYVRSWEYSSEIWT